MDPTTFSLVDACVDKLHDLARINSVNPEDHNIELVVHITQDEVNVCQYYFVDHATQTLFWLHPHVQATDSIFSGLRGVYDPSHIGASCRTYHAIGMN
jgi:hypothetical protein